MEIAAAHRWPMVVRFDYRAASPDELTVARGEVLLSAATALDAEGEQEEPGWLRLQRSNGTAGLVPENYCTPAVVRRALFDYKAHSADELDFVAGARLGVFEQTAPENSGKEEKEKEEEEEEGWCRVFRVERPWETGLVPDNYLGEPELAAISRGQEPDPELPAAPVNALTASAAAAASTSPAGTPVLEIARHMQVTEQQRHDQDNEIQRLRRRLEVVSEIRGGGAVQQAALQRENALLQEKLLQQEEQLARLSAAVAVAAQPAERPPPRPARTIPAPVITGDDSSSDEAAPAPPPRPARTTPGAGNPFAVASVAPLTRPGLKHRPASMYGQSGLSNNQTIAYYGGDAAAAVAAAAAAAARQ